MPDPIPELHVERLVLVEPGTHRPRAVLELLPARSRGECDHPEHPRPRFTLLTAAGDPALTVELDGHGAPLVQVGGQGRGTAVVMTQQAVSVWEAGNEVAVMDASHGGRVTLTDAAGRIQHRAP